MGLKYFIEHVVKLVSIFPFTERRQWVFSIIFKGRNILKWQMSTGFNVKSPAALAQTRDTACPLKPDIFFSVAMQVLDDIFFQ